MPNAQFWIAGEGELWDELHQKAEHAGFLQNVRFLGFRRDVANLMNAIDVMALPSHREPCALVYVEAALSRKPSIGCRSGGAPESIDEGETGLLVPVGDSAAMANALLAASHQSRPRITDGAGRLRSRNRRLRLEPLYLHARAGLRTRPRRKHRLPQGAQRMASYEPRETSPLVFSRSSLLAPRNSLHPHFRAACNSSS